MADTLAHARRLYIAAGVIAFAIIYVALRPWNLHDSYMIGAPFGRDFVNFWFGGHLVWTGNLRLLFDLRGYNSALSSLFTHQSGDDFIFSYPPHALFFLAPFGLLPYFPALLSWTALNLASLGGTVRLFSRDGGLALAACLSPAALTMVLYGHFGGMLALAATLTLVHCRERPWLSGLCLALLTVKPQFAIVMGLYLIALGRWRVLFAGLLFTAGLVAASIAAFGLQPWFSYLRTTVPFQARLLDQIGVEGASSTISLFTGLRLMGMGSTPAQVVQYLISIMLIGAAMAVLRQSTLTPRSLTIGLFAMIIGLPYSNHYDLAIAAPMFALALFDEKAETGARIPLSAGTVLLWLTPILALALLGWPSLPLANASALIGLFLLFAQSLRQKQPNPVKAPT
jgi:alpha-1,2-mannosyltransferase